MRRFRRFMLLNREDVSALLAGWSIITVCAMFGFAAIGIPGIALGVLIGIALLVAGGMI